ncbi:MAG: hypothetical protein Q9163_000834 [Psora crenata]
MAGHPADVQALLCDINGTQNYDEPQQHFLPFSRPPSHSRGFHMAAVQSSRQHSTPAYQQHSAYRPQSVIEQQTYGYKSYHDVNFDAYVSWGEPGIQSDTCGLSTVSLGPMGRLSLPAHTVPSYSPSPFFQQIHSQHGNQNKAWYVHTPPEQKAASSPSTNAPPSSPTVGVTQRRMVQLGPSGGSSAGLLSQHHKLRTRLPSNVGKRRAITTTQRDSEAHNLNIPPTPILSPPPQQPLVNSQPGLGPGPPIIQGIQLVSLSSMPDLFRSVFPFPLFNAIQSKCYATAYQSDYNLVVSAPTGGGKTAILEMAICRLIAGFKTDQYKVVYMAPTKSLCSERHRDWQVKFAPLGLQCVELTGDTDNAHLRSVQSAHIVVTTPEKWDSMTRKWKDHARLMALVKLLVIDEVHILKDARGATLEAVVSRMKSVGSNARFVALSATVPNAEDIALWLGRDAINQFQPAVLEKFGEGFRPVRLQKHVVGIPYRGSDFGFEGACDPLLPDIIAEHSHKKPMMIFCITRRSTVSTAKLLADLWIAKSARQRCWEGPTQRIMVDDLELRNTLSTGVAFHHAGLDSLDRVAVEKGFLEGQVNVICCTSTLAVGVNLPCHLVIIKNTVSYQDDGVKEYSDLEVMQMIGRAGRPQFDDSAVAVIITKQEKVRKYEKLVSGEELLESCLHLNLIDHLNAEIGLGTICDLCTAKKWLAGTFFYVRIGKNPHHYKLDGNATGLSLEERVERICRRDIGLLQAANLVTSDANLKATEFGDAMARYYVNYRTMRVLLGLNRQSKVSDILSALAQAEEYRDVRLRVNEKKLYREINRCNGIRFPIKVDIALPAHKRSLIVQSELGGVELPVGDDFAKQKKQFMHDKNRLFSNIYRLVRCVIDCQIHLQDAVAVRNALELARSLGARVWDNSPFQMKQIPQIGVVAIRKLANGGITNIEALEAAEPHRIETLLTKNPPFGNKILTSVQGFPKLRVSVKMMNHDSKIGQPVTIKMKVECGFMNDRPPMVFHRRPIHVCLLTERSDGYLIDFRRIHARQLGTGIDVWLSAELISKTQHITCYVMCDEIAGTLRYAELKPELPAYLFQLPSYLTEESAGSNAASTRKPAERAMQSGHQSNAKISDGDEFDDDALADQDMVNVVTGLDFSHIDSYDVDLKREDVNHGICAWSPEKLDNGKWACNHKCKDKTACKHFCCREGIDRRPKPPKDASVIASSIGGRLRPANDRFKPSSGTEKKSKVSAEKDAGGKTKKINSTTTKSRADRDAGAPREFRKLERLHEAAIKANSAPIVPRTPSLHYTERKRPRLSFRTAEDPHTLVERPSTLYRIESPEELPSIANILDSERGSRQSEMPDGKCLSPANFWYNGERYTEKEAHCNYLEASDPLRNFDVDQPGGDIPETREGSDGWRESTNIRKNVQTHDPGSHDPGSLPEKLFLSTDSPEDSTSLPQKRAAGDLEPQYSPSLRTDLKRCKISERDELKCRDQANVEKQRGAQTPAIRPGQPAWVYEFDPAFISEYQDFVEFV